MTPLHARAATRTRLSRALARRIDHLARAAHRFHRFAHHPLCERYASELIPFGAEARRCRGCAQTLIGLVAGLSLGVVWGPGAGWAGAALGVSVALALASRVARLPKSAGRFLPAALLTSALIGGTVPALSALVIGTFWSS